VQRTSPSLPSKKWKPRHYDLAWTHFNNRI
jgi:hypothetical protein